ncbi:MAG: hypothetical protein AAFV53_24590 [Myxococcota bacterium]
MHWFVACWLSAAAAQQLPRKLQPPEPRHQQDFTAYTVNKGQFRLGVGRLDYGVLDNFSLGTNTVQWVLGPNFYAKVTAIQTRRFDVSLQLSAGGVYDQWLMLVFGEDTAFEMNVIPTTIRSSLIITPKWSAHLGVTSLSMNAVGELSAGQIIEIYEQITASDALTQELEDLLADTVFANAQARLTLQQTHFAVEYRRNRRDSIIFEANSYVSASGLISGGVSTVSDEGSEANTSIGADFRLPLDTLPSAVSLSYQWSWERFHLRVGIPLTPANPLSTVQALELYWLLGPSAPSPDPTR